MQQTGKKASAGSALATALWLAVFAAGCTIDVNNPKGSDPCDPNPCAKQGACADWVGTCTVKNKQATCSGWKAAAGKSPVDAAGKPLTAPAAYEAVESLCDGIDNDCDGLVDEGVKGDAAAVCKGADQGVCKGASPALACVAGTWRCDFAAAPAWEASETTCDGVDNDCDGQTDEGVVPPANVCKRAGVCAGLPAPTCTAKGWDCHYGDIAAQDYQEATETTCDGKDNNCDGLVDNVGALKDGTTCASAGVCAKGVPLVCAGGQPTCNYAAIEGWQAYESKCDGVDNDCDGKTDNLPGSGAALFDGDTAGCKNAGVCKDAPTAIIRACQGGKLTCDYSAVPYFEAAESLCDGRDNDCDGKVDNIPTPPKVSPCGDKGVCASGKAVCQDGLWQCNWAELSGKGYEAFEATCDGKDNDCDGKDDNLSASAVPKGCKTKGVCAWGVAASCDKGAPACDYSHVQAYQESTETLCDGQDNDCDGDIDEAEGLDTAASGCALGVCAGKAKATCAGGKWQCAFDGVPDYESKEQSCDGKDNDCDGQTDEGLNDTVSAKCLTKGVCAKSATANCPAGSWVCQYGNDFEKAELSCDGLDNDCDGKTDEGTCAAGKSCAQGEVCQSDSCAALFGGSGSVCTLKGGQCARTGDDGGAVFHDSGAVACVTSGKTATCTAGKWSAATACPEAAPACVGGKCLVCVPDSLTCDFSNTKVVKCSADGGSTVEQKACASGERCLGQGACVVDGAIAVDDGSANVAQPAVIRLGDGFAVAWVGGDVFVRVFDASGKGATAVQVSATKKPVADQRVAISPAGKGFVVAWVTNSAGSGNDIIARFFDATGKAVSQEIGVNTNQGANQDEVAVAGNADGAVLVWTSATGDKSGKSIGGQRFDASGQAQGAELLINKAVDDKDDAESGDEYRPAVAMRSDGSFAVAWIHKPVGDPSTAIYGRRFDKSAVPSAATVRLSESSGEKRRDPSITWTGSVLLGAWVIETFNEAANIEMRRFDGALAALGKGVTINTLNKGTQEAPTVAAGDNGSATVVWVTEAAASAGSKQDIASRDVLAGGSLAPADAETLVTVGSLGANVQLQPSVARWDDGRVLTAWRDSVTDVAKGAIKAAFR